MKRFRPGVRMTVLVAVLVPLTLSLGFWQIERGAQKRAIEEARIASFGALPLAEQQLTDAPAFARVRLEGRYEGAHQFLVDNRTRRGVPGYFVVTPFNTLGGRRVLVNRGWVAAPVSRNALPDPSASERKVTIIGVMWAPSVSSTDASPWAGEWPVRVQQFDGKRMSESTGGAIPMEFRLEEGEPGGLEPIILGEEMSAVRHMGYAVQWFVMALALSIAFLALGINRGRSQ